MHVTHCNVHLAIAISRRIDYFSCNSQRNLSLGVAPAISKLLQHVSQRRCAANDKKAPLVPKTLVGKEKDKSLVQQRNE